MRNNSATLTLLADGNLELKFSYNMGLITALKLEIPYTDRTWQPTTKAWIVAPKHCDKILTLVAQYCGVNLPKPILSHKTSKLETRAIKLEYLGACKDRGNGVTATGWYNGGWNVIFPLSVLKAWFDPDAKERPSEAVTLYSILGLSSKAAQEEIKKSYRRLAKQWHPDVCKEIDAAEQFKKLQNAYEVLSNEQTRKKYNAGLRLEASLSVKHANQAQVMTVEVYRSPLRCGWILAEGEQVLNRFVVKKVLGWEDITNEFGRVMVSSWPAGKDHFTVEWI